MKTMLLSAILLLSGAAHAADSKISCKFQWKNTRAEPLSFYVVVRDLGTPKAKFVGKKTYAGDDWMQYLFGLKVTKKNTDDPNEGLVQMAMGDREQGYPGMDYTVGFTKSGDLRLNIDDGVSTDVDLMLYRNAGYRAGTITYVCGSECGPNYRYYAVVGCTIAPVAGI